MLRKSAERERGKQKNTGDLVVLAVRRVLVGSAVVGRLIDLIF